MKRKHAVMVALVFVLCILTIKGIGKLDHYHIAGKYEQKTGLWMATWIVKKQWQVLHPDFFYEERKASLNNVFYELLPGYKYMETYGTSEKIVLSEQSIPNTFLEDGGEEEESETAKEEATTMEPATTEMIVPNIEEANVAAGELPYSMEQLNNPDFLRQKIYSIDSATTVLDSELNAKRYFDMDFSLQKETSEPLILIYHTHTSEEYRQGKATGGNTVLEVENRLTELLTTEYGYTVLHDTTVYDVINGELDRNKAYTQSANGVEKILKEHPSIQVVIDLHRDGVAEQTKLVAEVNGKQTAQIMLFNGMSRTASNGGIAYLANPNREANLGFTFQLQMAAAKEFPGFTRKIFIRGYRYNLQFRPRCLLVEVGAQNNTITQAKNAMEPFAKILNEVLE